MNSFSADTNNSKRGRAWLKVKEERQQKQSKREKDEALFENQKNAITL